MEQDFWTKRWAEGSTGWHASEPNAFLVAHLDRLGCAPGEPILVPLCGASLDLGWLAGAAGLRPVGVEWAADAVAQYFADAGGAVPERKPDGAAEVWRADGVTILCGDWFAIGREHLARATGADSSESPIRAWWDRASLIALPPARRPAYAAHLAELLPTGARGLLLSLEYPQHELDGPPFSVEPGEVRDLFGAGFAIEELAHADALAASPKRQAQGLSRFDERLYLLSRR